MLALGSVSFGAQAVQLELEGGVSETSSHSTKVGFIETTLKEYRFGQSVFTWSPDFSLGFIQGRRKGLDERIRGYTYRRDVWVFAGGGRFRVGYDQDWYHNFFLSFQAAATRGRTIALSSAGEFVTSVGWGWHHFSLRIRHISNAGFHEPNRGETMLLAGVDFKL